MRVMGKRGLMVCMTVLMVLSGLEVSAEEMVKPEEIVVEAAVTVSGGDAEEPEEIIGTIEENREVFYAAGNIASGKDGDITWVIDASGKLTVEGTGNTNIRFEEAWGPYRSQITSAEINVSGMTDASYLFYGCCNMTSVDLSNFDTRNVTSMSCMFYGCSSLTSLDVSGFNTGNVTDMHRMFYGCSSLTSLDVSGFDTGNVTDMGGMFYGCSSLTSLDVSGFDTGNVTDMGGMFRDCSSLTSLDVSGFDTGNVTNMSGMFYMYSMLSFSGCSSLTSLDVSGFDTSNVTNMDRMFWGCNSLTSLDVSGFDTSNAMDMSYMFSACNNLTNLDVSGFDTGNVIDMDSMFCECNSLTSLDVSGFDTSNVTNMNSVFLNCNSLTSLDVSSFDTRNVTNMWNMFCGCSNLTSLDVSGFKTDNVTLMWSMFSGCSNLTSLDVSGFDIGNVTMICNMFNECKSLISLDVSGFNTSNVMDMSGMFGECRSLTSLDVSSFDTGNVRSMSSMFGECRSLTSLDVSGFDTSNVTDMRYMFGDCSSLTSLDISSFNTSNVTTTWLGSGMKHIFEGCSNLITVKTPQAMGTETADLPAIFINTNGAETQVLSKEFCNTILTRKAAKPEPANFTVVGTIGGRNVTFNNDSEDVVIYYSSKTSNLTTNDACVKPGETVLFENFYGTIYAKAYANGQWSNPSRLILKIPVVSKPTITYKDGVVTIKTTTPDSYIYYTTDGSTPSPTNGTRLAKSGGSFTVPVNCTVKAIAVRSCFTNSEIVSAKVAARKLGAPSFVVKGVIGGREVTFNTTETKGEIYYSFTTSNITAKDRHVKPGEKVLFQNYYGTVYARTYVDGQWSNPSRLILKIPVVNKPTIIAAGSGKVKITTSTPSCTIYYTTDGSTPSPTNGTRINSSSSIITVGRGKTVKAIAVRSCFTNSDVASYRQ